MEKLFRMNEAAKILGVTVKTLQRWDHSGKVTFVRTPKGQRRLPESEINRLIGNDADKESEKNLVIYARVSSHEQKTKGDLQRQIDFIKRNIDLNSYRQVTVIEDVGSGLNDKRKGLVKIMKLAEAGLITDLAIRYRDRLTRFGFDYLETYFESYQVTLHILDDQTDEKPPQEELVDDLIAIITSFSGKLYGIRSHKNKMVEEKVKEVLEDVANLPNETADHSTT
ncbi:IS607 family transposase [Neobacillus novalis]|uniref:IS607 family transposase n=1 Tax=Neobacillus novalis TaxID=220687 RepID=A0AA95MLG5_9BACI|nr:IS607 family transposase [Neobacillus novalis]WHY84384.1 IS607 family transposase [Neobacillus novalis]